MFNTLGGMSLNPSFQNAVNIGIQKNNKIQSVYKRSLDLMNSNIKNSKELENVLILYGKENLKHLNIQNNPFLKDITPLEEAFNLRTLNIFRLYNEFDDISPLKNKKLKQFKTGENRIGLKMETYQILKSMIYLELLSLEDCRIRNLDFLKNLKKLKILKLKNNENIYTLDSLSYLNSLENLNIENLSNITDLNPILKLNNLKEINLSGCFNIKNRNSIIKSLKQKNITVYE